MTDDFNARYRAEIMRMLDEMRGVGRKESVLACAQYLRMKGQHELADELVDHFAQRLTKEAA